MVETAEEAIAALSTFSLEDDQPNVHGPTACLSEDKFSFRGLAGYADVAAFRLDLEEDIEGINQMEDLLAEGREMLAVLYGYRSCVKALPQLDKPQKEVLGELYRETYHVLDTEIGRLRDLQRFQKEASERICADMERFLCLEKKVNGPTLAHTWVWLKMLDMLLLLDHLKNAKASIPNDFTWYKRTFSRVCMDREDGDSIKEENDNLQAFLTTRWSIIENLRAEAARMTNLEEMLLFLINFSLEMLESERVLLYTERHTLLRAVPLLLAMATPSEKDGDALVKSKKIKLERFTRLLKEDPIVPAFADLHMFPVTIVQDLSPYFRKLETDGRLDVLYPRDMDTRRANDYQSSYELVRHIHEYRHVHDEFVFRFAGTVNELQLLRKRNQDINDSPGFSRHVYDSVLEGLQLLSSYTGRVMEQCVWKYSRPARDAAPINPDRNLEVTAFERVVRCNYSNVEKKALVEMICYIKGMAGVLDKAESIVMDVVWEAVYKIVQIFAQGTLTPMLKAAMKRKKDFIIRLLWNLRSIVADWKQGVEPNLFVRRARRGHESLDLLQRVVAPSRAQLYAMQYLVGELLAVANASRGGFFGSDRELSSSAARELESFGQELLFVPYVLDFRHTLKEVSDLGFLWYREIYLEISHCVQFPIEASLPWMLIENILEGNEAGHIDSVLMPFDIYNDAAECALHVLKQRFLYDEIEAEADLCFDQLVFKLSEIIFAQFKARAASLLLDKSFLESSEYRDQLVPVLVSRFDALFSSRHVEILGRSMDLVALLAQRLNKIFRENLEMIIARFEASDLCYSVETQRLMDVLKMTHDLISEHLGIDPFPRMVSEMAESMSLVSFSSKFVTQVISDWLYDFLLNFTYCNATQRFTRCTTSGQRELKRPAMPFIKPSFLYGTPELNAAYSFLSEVDGCYFGLPHMQAVVKLVGPHCLPLLIQACLQHLTHLVTSVLPSHMMELLPRMPEDLAMPPLNSVPLDCLNFFDQQVEWLKQYNRRVDLLECLQLIGSITAWMVLMDMALREQDTRQMMQVAPFLGVISGRDGQLQHLVGDDDEQTGPLVSLIQKALSAAMEKDAVVLPTLVPEFIKSAQITESMYWSSVQASSVLKYAITHLKMSLDCVRRHWAPAPANGLLETRPMQDFCSLYSALQFIFCLEQPEPGQETHWEKYGDALSWGACSIIYLLGQRRRFEMVDFSYHLMRIVETDNAASSLAALRERAKGRSTATIPAQGRSKELKLFLANCVKAHRVNSFVMNMLAAHHPFEQKPAQALAHDGSLLTGVTHELKPSGFDLLPNLTG